MEAIKLDPWEGHVILYCKNWYYTKGTDQDFFEGLKNIWAIRCGVDKFGDEAYQYIANSMYKTIAKCEPKRLEWIHEQLHNDLCRSFSRPDGLHPIQQIIWFYRSILSNLQIRENGVVLIELPKPNKRVMKRIVRGNGRHSDYYLIDLKK